MEGVKEGTKTAISWSLAGAIILSLIQIIFAGNGCYYDNIADHIFKDI